MSLQTNPPSAPNGSTNGVSNDLELDIPKLHALSSEQQELYLLTFSTRLSNHVASLDKDALSSQQLQIKKEVLKIVTLASPPPSRVIRRNLGKCLREVLGKGNRSSLYEIVNDLVVLVSQGKSERELRTRHAAVHCLGEAYAAAGESAVSLSALACSTLMKALKAAQNHTGLRAAIYKALGKVVSGSGSGVDETSAREIWKHARNAASGDKAFTVQSSSCWCLEQLAITTTYFENANDFDTLKTTVWKVIESSSSGVRHAAASCLAAALVKSYSEDVAKEVVPQIRKPKKISKRQSMATEDGEEIVRPGSPSPKKAVVQLSLGLRDVLRQLSSQYVRLSITPRARAGIAFCYEQILVRLGPKVVEEQYSLIASHFFSDVLNYHNITFNRYRLLLTRKFVKYILEDVVGRRLLGETSQINAVRWLVNDVLKNYPQALSERPEPGKTALTAALSALASLLSTLGAAIVVLADACREGLLQVLQHTSYTVQVHAAHCLKNFVLACPQQLLSCLTICINTLNRELSQLNSTRPSPRRCVGFANGLAAMLSTSRLQPLYGSVDVYSRVLSLATELLKSSSSSELRVSAAQVQVAWILIGGLMPLGPNFVKIHLSQLLLLWKNALPRPLTKDNMAQRGTLEMSFLTHVRECALGSIVAFLEFNSRLVTTDGSKRIASMLQNTIMFLDSIPVSRVPEDISQRLSPSLQLNDLALMVRRRVLQCFSKLVHLSHLGHSEVLSQSNVLSVALSSFADPDARSPRNLEASLANSASNFESLWDVADNWGSGVTGLIRGFRVRRLPGEHEKEDSTTASAICAEQSPIDESLISPICPAREHDSLLLYCLRGKYEDVSADPPATEVVNAAIELFAVSFPLQGPKIQESTLEQLATFLSAHSLQRNPARKAAMVVNSTVALLNALKVSIRETQYSPGDLRSPSTEKIIQELLRKFILDPDPIVRHVAAEAMGRLCNSSGNALTGGEINNLIETIVANRDPNARAGCALTLGCIHSQVGGMAAGFHLKTIIGVLMSLCSDLHPVVHFWALEGMTRVIDSAGLTFSGYVSGTLGMLAQLYISDSHNEEVQSLASSNAETEYCSIVLLGRAVDALINVLGPDLQDMSKARELIFSLVKQFGAENDNVPLMEQGLKCLEHLSLYAPGLMEYEQYVHQLHTDITSPHPQIREAAFQGLNNLMKRDAEDVLKTASPGLEDEFWLALDSEPGHVNITNIIRNWLLQTGLTDTDAWVQRCQTVLSKIKSKKEEPPPPTTTKTAGIPELQDEEVAGFASANANNQGEVTDDNKAAQELLKWQTRSFAMSCMSELLSMVSAEVLPDQTIPAEAALQQRIGDVVRFAFSASTANVVELRIWGLKIIDQILKMFGKTPDPDFSEASLLEQYQAQIGSALTPAFAADSSPELASEAVNVCASFVATGIVTNVDRMGRIFKLLVTAMENFAVDPETTSIGDLKGLSSNARVMVKMSVFSAWAQLQIASSEQKYLVEIVAPYTAKLTPLWLSSLQEFARLRFEPDISSTMGTTTSGNLDEVYAALNRETLLEFYQDSWLNLVDAIASLVERDSGFVFDALDGKFDPETDGSAKRVVGESRINYREEPVAFFFVLFGLAFEALVGQANHSQAQVMEILQALKRILRPSVSGNAIYQDAVFSETMDSLDRLALTEGPEIQAIIVEISRNLSLDHLAGKGTDDRDEKLSDDIEQLFELTRIIIIVLAGLLPNLGDSTPHIRHSLTEDAVSLIQLSLNALVDVAEVFPSIIRADLHACIMHVFCTILATGACQQEVVPQALPTLKRFIQSVTKSVSGSTNQDLGLQIRGCLRRCLTILSHAQRRETESSLPCAKNTLLTTTILLTAGGASAIPPNDDLVTSLLSEMLDCLGDIGLANVAANCMRSLLLVPSKSTTDDAIARFLVPRLVLFVTMIPNDSNADPEKVRGQVTQTLTSWVITLAQGKRPAAIAVLMSALLRRASLEGETVFKECASRLVELAGADQGAFKAIVTQMGPDQRAFMEHVIRSGGGVGVGGAAGGAQGRGTNEIGGDVKPSIELRMDF